MRVPDPEQVEQPLDESRPAKLVCVRRDGIDWICVVVVPHILGQRLAEFGPKGHGGSGGKHGVLRHPGADDREPPTVDEVIEERLREVSEVSCSHVSAPGARDRVAEWAKPGTTSSDSPLAAVGRQVRSINRFGTRTLRRRK